MIEIGKASSAVASSLPIATDEQIETARHNGRGCYASYLIAGYAPVATAMCAKSFDGRRASRISSLPASAITTTSLPGAFRAPSSARTATTSTAILKQPLPDLVRRRWSFAIAEIRQVITPVAHQKHIVDFARAHELALDVLAGKGANIVPQLRLDL
jgi:hypothetical protein